MGRYNGNETKLRFDRTVVYKTTIFPLIPLRSDDLYIFANAGDRLDLLANKYYNDVNLWWVLARANDIGKGSLYVEGGTQLRIPTNIIKIINDREQLNKNR